MRIFKFRVWKKDGEMKMLRVSELSWELNKKDGIERMFFGGKLSNEMDKEGAVCSGFGATDGSESFSPWVLMQYTGLQDRKGKDIYEGDILKDFRMFQINKKVAIHRVDYIGGSFCLMSRDQVIPIFAYDGNVLKNCEIIGNVCENPKLDPERIEKYENKNNKIVNSKLETK
jgi:uncharacterized phage protein (TIGR01671 family)